MCMECTCFCQIGERLWVSDADVSQLVNNCCGSSSSRDYKKASQGPHLRLHGWIMVVTGSGTQFVGEVYHMQSNWHALEIKSMPKHFKCNYNKMVLLILMPGGKREKATIREAEDFWRSGALKMNVFALENYNKMVPLPKPFCFRI